MQIISSTPSLSMENLSGDFPSGPEIPEKCGLEASGWKHVATPFSPQYPTLLSENGCWEILKFDSHPIL